MARKNNVTVTADTTPESVIEGITPESSIAAIGAAVLTLGRIESAVGKRTFDLTLAVKRSVGHLLDMVVVHARAAGKDAGKVGAVDAAITFANVTHALGMTGLAWSWQDRTRSTLSDDLNAWHDATPTRVASFRKLDAPMMGKRKLSTNNVQDAIAWCHKDAAGTTSNRASTTRSPLNDTVVVKNDARLAMASTLTTTAVGPTSTAPITVPVIVPGTTVSTPVLTPDAITPGVLASWTDNQITAVILACEGERKRRAMIADGKVVPTTPGVVTVPVPDAATTAVVDAIAAPDASALLAQLAQLLAPR